MTKIDGIDYGPLVHLVGEWRGDTGMDISPEPEGTEHSPYFEHIQFEAIGDVTNAESQTLSAIRYHQVVSRHSDKQVFHNETGYWLWDPSSQSVMQTLTIPRGVSLVAGGTTTRKDSGDIVINVEAADGDANWGIAQSPFMRDRAKTLTFQRTLEFNETQLAYSQTMLLEIYGKRFEHTDQNTLVRV